ncbi:hypothetical protein VTN77DRAFT_82 [Rasamsonia byssochlamydoides]|uniref:uncharacterized protein n=1 Tax=Rasamsonia byssochlamydoides TaxID=89139 RepID=UPI0037449F91
MSDVDVVSSSLLAAPTARDVPAQEENQKAFRQKLTSPPPLLPPEEVPRGKGDAVVDNDELLSPKADSEAETIIQSGRESLSPEKRRKHIQHERRHSDDRIDDDGPSVEIGVLSPNSRKRKRMEDDPRDEGEQDSRKSSPRPRASSPSSVVKTENTEAVQSFPRRRDSAISGPTVRQTDDGDLNERKRSSSESAIEGDATDTGNRIRVNNHQDTARDRERREKTHPTPGPRESKDHSPSPSYRSHKRAVSGPQHGIAENQQRKKKTPAPLLTGRPRHSSEDRQSVSSSTSGSPMPSAHIRRLASDGAATSPAKPTTHKKQRDQNGRTRLARACAAQELEAVMARHAERPEDLNVPDNAGNTPLQIAALEGCAPIVKYLLEQGCEVDTKNIDKDTPLIDAVENGHLEVVKLLLEAGANPRIPNAEGDEPYDLVPSDSEDYEEIRRVLAEAKANPPPKRRSEDSSGRASSSKDSVPRGASASSPRESPPAHNTRSPPPTGMTARRRTVRSEATRNDLLWTKATPENLREFAAKGDMAGVANILNVLQKADTESLIAAAKGGHDDVMQLLLGIGYADPDPEPLETGNLRPGYNTPMLAAIGRGNLAVIGLLLDQPGFNPTRRLFRDRTYYELSRERKGENWEEESELLKTAYDNYIRNKKMRKPETKSPRRSRDKEREVKKPVRRDSSSPVAPPSRRAMRSPTSTRHADSPSKESSTSREKVRDGSSQKASEPDTKPKTSNPERRQSESRGDEVVVKRRRLIAGRPPQDQDRRRPSQVSDSGREEGSKAHDERASMDTQAAKLNSPSLKRSRSSVSPERSHSRGSEQQHDSEELQKKKRRVLLEDNGQKLTNGMVKKSQDSAADSLKNHSTQGDQNTPDSERSKSKADSASEKDTVRPDEPVPVKEEQRKVDTQELDDIPMDAGEAKTIKTEAEARKREEEARKAEEERAAVEAERARIAKEEEEAKEAAERAARLAKAEEEERKRKEAEQRRVKQTEEERQRRIEQDRLWMAKVRREQEEQEQRRRDALPDRLRVAANLIGSNDPRARSHAWLKQFMPVVTAKTEQIDPSCDSEIAEERWVPNFLVAPLLATNDLQLSQYASWEKRKATPTQRMNLWRVTRRILIQSDDSEASFGQVIQKDGETRLKYFDMEHVFWVRLSDFMDLVPHIPHLHGLEIQFLKMHIDREPQDSQQVNGNAFYSENHDGMSAPNGLTNGYGRRPSTYA